MNRRQVVSAAVAAAVSLVLAGCGDKTSQELKVGATAGPHAAIVAEAAKVAAKSGLKVKVVEFTDYIPELPKKFALKHRHG